MDLKCKIISNRATCAVLLLPTLQCGLAVLILILVERLNALAQNRFHTTMTMFGDYTIVYQMYSVRLKIIYVACISLLLRSYNEPYSRHLAFALKFWVIFALETSAEAVIIIVQYFLNRQAMETMLGQYLAERMQTYVEDSESRQIWDGVQLNGECCGLYGYEDWFDVSDSIVMSNYTFLPYSCCRKDKNCYATVELDNYVDEIYRQGCLENIFDLIRSIKHFVIALMIVTIVLQFIVLIAMRILFLCQRRYDFSEHNDDDGNDDEK